MSSAPVALTAVALAFSVEFANPDGAAADVELSADEVVAPLGTVVPLGTEVSVETAALLAAA